MNPWKLKKIKMAKTARSLQMMTLIRTTSPTMPTTIGAEGAVLAATAAEDGTAGMAMAGTGIVGIAISPVNDGQETTDGKAASGKEAKAVAIALDKMRSRRSRIPRSACAKPSVRRASLSRRGFCKQAR